MSLLLLHICQSGMYGYCVNQHFHAYWVCPWLKKAAHDALWTPPDSDLQPAHSMSQCADKQVHGQVLKRKGDTVTLRLHRLGYKLHVIL